MYIQVGTIDGEVYTSDVTTLVESGLTPEEFEAEVSNLEGMFQNWDDVSHFSLNILGQLRYFNPRNIVWGEIVY